ARSAALVLDAGRRGYSCGMAVAASRTLLHPAPGAGHLRRSPALVRGGAGGAVPAAAPLYPAAEEPAPAVFRGNGRLPDRRPSLPARLLFQPRRSCGRRASSAAAQPLSLSRPDSVVLARAGEETEKDRRRSARRDRSVESGLSDPLVWPTRRGYGGLPERPRRHPAEHARPAAPLRARCADESSQSRDVLCGSRQRSDRLEQLRGQAAVLPDPFPPFRGLS